ncbi:MAG: insulinase family protein [Candidatus Margulisbacteria bacterium]|nr:insulinase family protein [Candidatus Margulisiibacteriota bacterium]
MITIPDASTTTLKNGLTIITENIPAMRSVSLGVLLGTGSGNEEIKEAGLSHFIEHLTFKGTAKRSAFEIAHTLDAVGGKINAFTSKEVTMYYCVVLDKHIDIAIDVLSDIILNSKYDSEHLQMEKGVILEEIKMYEDTPDEQIHDFFDEKILHDHPIGRPTIGLAKTVKGFKREDVLNYQNKWYTPDNAIVSIAGAIQPDVLDKVSQALKSWQGKKKASPQGLPKIKGSLNLKKKKTEQVHLCLGTKGVSQTNDNRYPYAILDNILGGSMSSRLFQEVREKRGLVYSIYSTSSPFRDFGVAYVYAGTSQKNMEQVIELILKEFSQIKKQGITKEELERAKEFIKGTLVLGLESTSSRMSWLAKSQFYHGRPTTIDEIFAKVEKVTQKDILRLANEFFQDKYLTLAVIGDLRKLPIKTLSC